MQEAEMLELKFERVLRKTSGNDLVQDINGGYVYFDANINANGKSILINKRIRLDKPEKMLNKFVTKIKALAEEKYKYQKYYVANKNPPPISVVLENEEGVNDRMRLLFEEVSKYSKTGNQSVLATDSIDF